MDHVHQHQHAHAHAHLHPSKREGGMAYRVTPSRTTIIENTRVLVARATCTNDSDDGCRKPTQTPTTVIVVAVVVPVLAALIVFFYLHRRNLRKLREEDAKDKYRSYDFGLEGAKTGQKGKKAPEMASADEKSLDQGHNRGLSTDVMSPYILAPGLHGSRESFHSLARSANDPHDPYRQVVFGKGDGASIRSETRSRLDTMSVYTTSSGDTDKNGMNNGLLQNAQRMSQSYPPRAVSKDRTEQIAIPLSPLSPLNPYSHSSLASPPPASNPGASEDRPSSYVAYQPPAPAQVEVQQAPVPAQTTPSPPPFPRIKSQEAVVQDKTNSYLSTSSYGDAFELTPPSPHTSSPPQAANEGPFAPQPLRPYNDMHDKGLGVDNLGFNPNRLSISARPLPPDDPSENPEERANRIRSFYKEYFDDSKPEPVGGHIYNDYYEDYGSEYLDGAVFDPQAGAFVVAQPQAPYAAPVTRRAMTPPPRAPPRFRSNTGGGAPPRSGYMSGQSSAASSPRFPPRNMSSMSGRLPPPRKPMAPPTPLASLPTPSKLTETSMLYDPTDFAPPISYRDRQAGRRPDSPLGAPRPFSPSVRPHTPLAGSFDDLTPMPSPHLLRKSGTFTALDFAPPPRLRDPGSNGSDAGSIRSNRSGMSAAGRNAVRAGAYRVSRIPKEVVGTRDDLMASLRPTMDLGRPS